MSKKIRENIYIQLFVSFFRCGILTFGGGLAMLPLLEKEVVESRGWATNEELLDMYAIGQTTPGIIAVNVATFTGYKKAGVLGGIVGTLGMITPSLIIITVIASGLSYIVKYPIVQHALAGIRLAVCGMMIVTVVKLVKNGVKDIFGIIICVGTLLIAVFTPVSTVFIVIAALILGILVKRNKVD
ncbi:MAG: chromate transporter [Lachnospiraceae bacterium]|jgi:chromate transporter|nr:chromate transporter [Lachnospiraceae bacterium]